MLLREKCEFSVAFCLLRVSAIVQVGIGMLQYTTGV